MLPPATRSQLNRTVAWGRDGKCRQRRSDPQI